MLIDIKNKELYGRKYKSMCTHKLTRDIRITEVTYKHSQYLINMAQKDAARTRTNGDGALQNSTLMSQPNAHDQQIMIVLHNCHQCALLVTVGKIRIRAGQGTTSKYLCANI